MTPETGTPIRIPRTTFASIVSECQTEPNPYDAAVADGG